jgi:hypothetical protein
LSFFSSDPAIEALMGDLTEEFHERLKRFSPRAARFWVWKETIRNAGALTMRELLRTPMRTAVTAVGCVLAVNAITISYVLSVGPRASFDVAQQWRMLLFLQFITPLVLGWVGGKIMGGREWALALTYTAASICYTVAGIIVIGSRMPLEAAIQIARPLWTLAIWGNGFRQGAFWLGCLLAMLHHGDRGPWSKAAKRFLSIAILALSGGSALLSQVAPPAKLSGQWKLNVEKSTFGAPLLPGTPAGLKITSQTVKIEQNPREVRLSGDTLYSDNRGDHSTHDDTTLSLDGKPTVLGPISLLFRGIDDSAFEIVSQLTVPGHNVEEVSHFSVSEDGRTLTETKTQTEKSLPGNNSANKTSTFVLVFSRLPDQ